MKANAREKTLFWYSEQSSGNLHDDNGDDDDGDSDVDVDGDGDGDGDDDDDDEYQCNARPRGQGHLLGSVSPRVGHRGNFPFPPDIDRLATDDDVSREISRLACGFCLIAPRSVSF